MKLLKHFKPSNWYKQTNPAYKQSCFKQHSNDLVTLKGKYDYLMKHLNDI